MKPEEKIHIFIASLVILSDREESDLSDIRNHRFFTIA